MTRFLRTLFSFLLSTAALCECRQADQARLTAELLFELELGKLEDQVNLVVGDDNVGSINLSLFVKNDFFYISDAQTAKLMVFNAFGEIMSLYYNAGKTPKPLRLAESKQQSATRKAFAFPFNRTGAIAVNQQGETFISDLIAKPEPEDNQTNQHPFSYRILHFDRRGQLVKSSNGLKNAYPYIKSMRFTQKDELVIVARSSYDWIVFWHGKNGELLREITFKPTDIPQLDFVDDNMVFAEIKAVERDPSEMFLYLMIDYSRYQGVKNNFTDQPGSLVWRYSIEQARFVDYVNLSSATTIPGSEKPLAYEFIGMAAKGRHFILSYFQNNLCFLTIIRKDGQVILQNELLLGEGPLISSDFYVSFKGTLNALLGRPYSLEIKRWRFDKYIGG